MPRRTIDLLEKARQANLADKYRQANLITLPRQGSLIITGDVHGHRRNFERICAFADLRHNPKTHLIFHEILHGGREDDQGGCLSYELLFELARYKLEFPDQIHIIMGNHDTAVINQGKVMKNGKEMNAAMRAAMKRRFAKDTGDVELALRQFLFSQPLAVRCENRLWLSHSLPDDNYFDKFDCGIFHRQLKIDDVIRPNSAYLLTWGRKHSRQTLEKLAKLLDVDIFILGHQPQEQGFGRMADNLLIIASDHNHGTLLLIDLDKEYNIDQLVNALIPLAAIA